MVPCGTPSNSLKVKSDVSYRIAQALHKLSYAYLSLSTYKRFILSRFDFSSITLTRDNDSNKWILSLSIALSDSLYNAIVSQSTTNVNLGVDFAVYPVLGDISYKVDSGALTKITYTKDEPNFGWLTCFSTPTYSLPARLPYGIMTSALHATALSADVAPTSFVRARLLDKVVDLYDDYSSSPYYDSSSNPFGLKNWTDKVDHSSKIEETLISEQQAKQILFTYKNDKIIIIHFIQMMLKRYMVNINMY